MATTPSAAQAILYSVHETIVNKKDPYYNDRQMMPFRAWVYDRKEKSAFNQGKVVIKLGRATGQGLEYWDGLDVLTFSTYHGNMEMSYSPSRLHMGRQWPHTDFEDMGFVINPNEVRGKNFAKKVSEAQADMLIDYFAKVMNEWFEDWDVATDIMWHRTGAQDADAPVGLDGLLPLTNTTGTIGEQPRSDPYFQHHVETGLTSGNGGTMERGLNTLHRDCMRNNRGRVSMITHIFAGEEWIDEYVNYARANGMPYERNGGTAQVSRIDIAAQDTTLQFQGIPIIMNPTHAKLDAAGFYSGTTWAKRAYHLSAKNWTLYYNKIKHFSAPMDPANQRVTRASLEERSVLTCDKPNGQGVSTVD